MSLDPDTPLRFSPLHRLQWEEAQQRHVILYPEGLVELNATSAEILKLCDGRHTLRTIVEELERKYQTQGLTDDIREFLEIALENGWIETAA
ncbi:pyrroloquinoline quinone biosynthesis protein D [Methylomarinovum caldicuralii]|uniref:Pyrroloquinoline quinone biosynthesis protein D n=1 Tax=Methylomarinovum caldicuralii TaxID=438856 RepID=A0AAU9CY12_9GAMM|nr:pyrroloquinoline quinone biosynthesis peptide chaperone PqqD [Methylomarinovum caldicuralii]BCX82912.1 pyrroloquinoline quinone biosynthesis protein D [Methylomarinovum caldicuralii]